MNWRMSKADRAKIQLSRSLKRRTSAGYETLTINVETSLPHQANAQGFLAELEATIRRILPDQDAAPVARSSSRAPDSVQVVSPNNPQSTNEFYTAIMTSEGKTLAHLSMRGARLRVSVVEDWRLKFSYAPVQSFLIPRILNTMRSNNELQSYEFDVTSDGCITGIRAQFPSVTAQYANRRVKNLVGAICWTLRTLASK